VTPELPDLRVLRSFVVIAEEGSLSRAAARLHISQPPLSQQIKQLEEELGCTLLARTRRRVELTPAGSAFLRDARAMLAELDVAASTARAIDAGQAGVLRVNFVGSALLSVVPGTVQRFRRARPGVEVEVRERSTIEQLRAQGRGPEAYRIEILRRHVAGGRLAEIGPGDGIFVVQALDAGFEVSGIEMDPAACEHLRATLGILARTVARGYVGRRT